MIAVYVAEVWHYTYKGCHIARENLWHDSGQWPACQPLASPVASSCSAEFNHHLTSAWHQHCYWNLVLLCNPALLAPSPQPLQANQCPTATVCCCRQCSGSLPQPLVSACADCCQSLMLGRAACLPVACTNHSNPGRAVRTCTKEPY